MLKETWFIIENAEDNKEKLAALSLAKDCYTLQEELICNLPIIDEALKLDSEGRGTDGTRIAIGGESGIEEDQTPTQAVTKEEGQEEERDGEGKERGVGEKEKDDIQRFKEKVRENQNSETTNKTF